MNGKNADKIEEKQVRIWYCTDTEEDTDDIVDEYLETIREEEEEET